MTEYIPNVLNNSELEELRSRLKNEFSGYTELAGGKNYRYFHLKSVHKYTKKLMDCEEVKELEFDERVVEVAALFHDIGRTADIEDGYMDPFEGSKGHDERGEEIVADFVQDFVTEEQLEKVQKIIGNHHSEAETVEGKILQDSDELFKFGIQNFWRMFHYAANKERTLQGSIEYFHDTAVPELNELIDDFYFEKTKATARKRVEDQKQTIRKIEDELEGNDI